MITNNRIEVIAREMVRDLYPDFERTNPAHFEGVVQIIKNTIVDDYGVNSIREETTLRQLMKYDLESLKEALN